MTGGRRGLCNPATAASARASIGGYGGGLGLRRGFRGGFGSGRARRRGFGRDFGWYSPAAGPADAGETVNEAEALRCEAAHLKSSLEAIRKRIDALESKPADET
jgi:hypothetical protein